MTHMAVITLMMDHIKDDLFCLHEDTKILKMHKSFVETNDERQTEKNALTFILIQIIAFGFALGR